MITKADQQRIADRELINSLVLKPCPLCGTSKAKVPEIYRGRCSEKWLMKQGFFGCHHANQPRFSKLLNDAVDHANEWNKWVDENTQPEQP